jgi:hypothetical protein
MFSVIYELSIFCVAPLLRYALLPLPLIIEEVEATGIILACSLVASVFVALLSEPARSTIFNRLWQDFPSLLNV